MRTSSNSRKIRQNDPNGPTSDFIDDIVCQGVDEIAAYIRKSKRQTYRLLETGQLPAFKMGERWHLRPSRYRQHIAELENETLARRAG
jgi:excisionase family DNA binding protein